MKKSILLQLIILFSSISLSLHAQIVSEKIKGEINQTLEHFNTAAKNSNTEQLMALFDDSANIMFIGGGNAVTLKTN